MSDGEGEKKVGRDLASGKRGREEREEDLKRNQGRNRRKCNAAACGRREVRSHIRREVKSNG